MTHFEQVSCSLQEQKWYALFPSAKYRTTFNLISTRICVVEIITALTVKIFMSKILIHLKLRSRGGHLGSLASHSSPPFFQLQHSFSIWILFLYFSAHGRVIIFPALLFFICCTCYMYAFEGIPHQALYGSFEKKKAQGGVFLSHMATLAAVEKIEFNPCEWQPLIIDTIKPGIREWAVNQNNTMCNQTERAWEQ